MSELGVLLFITGIGYITLIPSIAYFLSYLDRKHIVLLSCLVLAYTLRLIFKAGELAFLELGLSVSESVSRTVSSVLVFLVLIGLSLFVSAILARKHPVGGVLFYVYALLSLIAVVTVPDVPVKRLVNLLMATPYISLITVSAFFRRDRREEPPWFLSKISRMILAGGLLILLTAEIIPLFTRLSPYYSSLYILPLVLLHFSIFLGGFKTTAYFLDQLDHDYLIITSQGKILSVSPSFKKNAPFSTIFSEKSPSIEELSSIIDLDDLQNLKVLQGFYSRITAKKPSWQTNDMERFALKFVMPDGSSLPYILEIVPCSILVGGTYSYYIVLFESSGLTPARQDIAEQMNKDYLSLMVHDLRNSLVTASGYVSLLKKSLANPDEKILERYEIITRNFVKMESLVDRISDMARKDVQPLELEEVSIFKLLFQIVENLKIFVLMKSVKLEITIQPPVDLIVRADEALLTLAVENLVHNAIKYSPEGSVVAVNCHVSRGKMDHQVLVIEIVDRGIGIPVIEMGRLFTPNFRASNVTGIQGQGLGLYHANRTIKQHGGKLEVISEGSGKGTMARITLRLPKSKEPI